LATGEEVAEFVESSFGVQPEWSKEDLVGQMLIIRGLSDETWQQIGSNFPPARSILYSVDTDQPGDESWGMMFSDNSPIIEQVRRQFRRNGGKPFVATLQSRDSEAHKGQTYWILTKYVENVTPKDEVSTGKQKKG